MLTDVKIWICVTRPRCPLYYLQYGQRRKCGYDLRLVQISFVGREDGDVAQNDGANPKRHNVLSLDESFDEILHEMWGLIR